LKFLHQCRIKSPEKIKHKKPVDTMLAKTQSGDINEYIISLKNSSRLGNQVVHHTILRPEKPRYADTGSDKNINNLLKKIGIRALYTHQYEAISRIQRGDHVVVATPTASGKTLIYNLPVMQRIAQNPETRALYLFPLKALAQDQLKTFEEMSRAFSDFSMSAAIYDGDTTAWHRKKIRENPPNVIMTNPEMLHLTFLAHHEKWGRFLGGLDFVVIDEVHTYRGILGSHMAQVLRRFRRILAEYGAKPVFVFSSATIGNPAQLSSALTGLDVSALDHTGAPTGKRHLVYINPVDSPAGTAILLLKAALHRNLRTIVYCQSRKMTELISLWAGSRKGVYSGKISAYRAGFLPEERREIEQKLATGQLLAVISTSALELGIDIGDLDLCILVGYPGTIMATRQRGGRVGRSGRDAAIVMVAGEDALDQYIMRHAADVIKMAPESAMVNPDNKELLERHLVCAAAEKPLQADDVIFPASRLKKSLARLVEKGQLLCAASGNMYYAARKQPHRSIDLRGSGSRYNIIEGKTGENMGEIDGFRAFRETHPGAVYLHLGNSFRVDRLDPETRTIIVSRANPNYYTRVQANKNTEILEEYSRKAIGSTWVGYGRLRVTDQVTGYERRQIRDQKRINIMPLDLPAQVFETEGLWILIPARVQAQTEKAELHFMGGIHAIEHAAIGICPLLVLCDRNDLAGISTPYHQQVAGAAVFVYDAFPGGIGLCKSAWNRLEDMLANSLKTIADCSCENGCPACVHSPKCGSGNRPIDKAAAEFILRRLLGKKNKSRKKIAPWPEITPQTSEMPTASPLPEKRYADIDHYGVLDIETRLGAQEVGGWSRASEMGISCAVIYDSKQDKYCVYQGHETAELMDHLNALELVIGFNIKRFDYQVISGYVTFPWSRLPTLDILEDVHSHLGYRLSLDHLARVSLGVQKSGDGLQALEWWKQGRLDEIIKYCKKDVEITRDLFLFGRKNGYLLFENKAKKQVRIPVNW
jgi:DEAD/DEAH box helicase domain-containing protein